MEGYLVTKEITWVSNNFNGPYRAYVFEGTIYLPSIHLKLDPTKKQPEHISALELQNAKEFGLMGEPKIKKIEIEESMAKNLLDLIHETDQIPKKLETAVKEILSTPRQP